jgi:hypothetical protein
MCLDNRDEIMCGGIAPVSAVQAPKNISCGAKKKQEDKRKANSIKCPIFSPIEIKPKPECDEIGQGCEDEVKR